MSARQLRRVAGRQGQPWSLEKGVEEDVDEDEEEGSDEEPIVAIARQKFTFGDTSSDESENSSSDEAKAETEQSPAPSAVEATDSKPQKGSRDEEFKHQREKQAVKKAAAKGKAKPSPHAPSSASACLADDSDDKLLDSIIESVSRTDGVEAEVLSMRVLLQVEDLKNLDVGNTLRRRFGGLMNERAPGARRNNNPNNRALSRVGGLSAGKRFVYGAPNEEWPKPPPFIAGGMGMSRSKKTDEYDWYSFQWSDEFEFVESQYSFIENSGDARLIVMFLAHFPHHPRALLQLAMLYARTGQMDRASLLVRRTLWLFESSCLESFKPPSAGSGVDIRMNPYDRCNVVFFDALYRYMQICSMQGCMDVAADVCKVILSLHPADDKYFLVLTLDYFLVSAGRLDQMLGLCGLHAASLRNTIDRVAVEQFSFVSPYRLGHEDSPEVNPPWMESAGCTMGLEHLPNWWFSLPLSLMLHVLTEKNRAKFGSVAAESTVLYQEASCYLLKAAILRWPFMLQPLLDTVSLATSTAAAWKTVFSQALFSDSESKMTAGLKTVRDVYALRHSKLWAKEDVQKWMLQCATELFRDGDRKLSPRVGSEGLVGGYARANVEEFREEYARLPDDVELFDPQLDDPEILNGAWKFQNFMDGEGRFLFPVPPGYVSVLTAQLRDEQDAQRNAFAERVGREMQMGNVGAGVGPAIDVMGFGIMGGGNRVAPTGLDYNLPLMQLFIMTLFPWVDVTPPRRG
ncbi:transcriptional repressor TCF25-domain-containing protein [Ochromonadaceae sp. CCMP2298]|nr:transcriptional repressor TCF25-domain-containing protein [Ochromonadaceae sp. CCMP2298]